MKLNYYREILCQIQNVFEKKTVDMALTCVSVLFSWPFLHFIFPDCDSNGELQDLLSEYNLLKDIDHPNVIKLLGACTRNGTQFPSLKKHKLYFPYTVENVCYLKRFWINLFYSERWLSNKWNVCCCFKIN